MSVLKVLGDLVVLWIVIGSVSVAIKGQFFLFVIACVALGLTLLVRLRGAVFFGADPRPALATGTCDAGCRISV